MPVFSTVVIQCETCSLRTHVEASISLDGDYEQSLRMPYPPLGWLLDRWWRVYCPAHNANSPQMVINQNLELPVKTVERANRFARILESEW